MKRQTKRIGLFIVCFSLIFNVFIGSAGAEMKMEQGEHGMTMHHQHIMLNHALGMVIEGSNMIMLSEMAMTGGVDKVSLEHGQMMMADGRALFNELMSGETMMKMHAAGTTPTDDPMMKYTHQLAEAQLKVMDLLAKMPPATSEMGPGMTMHHQHEMLNHALKMALEGSNMVMLGEMKMTEGVDRVSMEHGKKMMGQAEALINEIMSGKTMMEMHGKGMTPEKEKAMGYTHHLAEAELKVISLLKAMPTDM
jgi:hypothetical protein